MSKIEIQINCDDISISKSSNSQFWSILILICQFINPIIVGCILWFFKID